MIDMDVAYRRFGELPHFEDVEKDVEKTIASADAWIFVANLRLEFEKRFVSVLF